MFKKNKAKIKYSIIKTWSALREGVWWPPGSATNSPSQQSILLLSLFMLVVSTGKQMGSQSVNNFLHFSGKKLYLN
jgi:hypothetical protein